MSNPDPYAAIGGNYRIDEAGNRVPDEEWPNQFLKPGQLPEAAPEAPAKPAKSKANQET